MAMEYVNAVVKPIATVDKTALGISLSGCEVSSLKWVTLSRQANDQAGLINPTINAIPFDGQPVPFVNSTKTK